MQSGKLIGWFGKISLAISAIATIAAFIGVKPEGKTLSGYLFLLAMLAVVSGAQIIAARLKAKNDPLAEKVIPSSVVAYLLVILMIVHWLSN